MRYQRHQSGSRFYVHFIQICDLFNHHQFFILKKQLCILLINVIFIIFTIGINIYVFSIIIVNIPIINLTSFFNFHTNLIFSITSFSPFLWLLSLVSSMPSKILGSSKITSKFINSYWNLLPFQRFFPVIWDYLGVELDILIYGDILYVQTLILHTKSPYKLFHIILCHHFYILLLQLWKLCMAYHFYIHTSIHISLGKFNHQFQHNSFLECCLVTHRK